MAVSATYDMDHGRHFARFSRRRRCWAYTPTRKTASHDNLEKNNLWVFLFIPYESGALHR